MSLTIAEPKVDMEDDIGSCEMGTGVRGEASGNEDRAGVAGAKVMAGGGGERSVSRSEDLFSAVDSCVPVLLPPCCLRRLYRTAPIESAVAKARTPMTVRAMEPPETGAGAAAAAAAAGALRWTE